MPCHRGPAVLVLKIGVVNEGVTWSVLDYEHIKARVNVLAHYP
jgi:hypothetical protein